MLKIILKYIPSFVQLHRFYLFKLILLISFAALRNSRIIYYAPLPFDTRYVRVGTSTYTTKLNDNLEVFLTLTLRRYL